MYRNTKNVPYYVFGRGSLAQLGDLLKPRREAVDGPVVYFVDHFFRDHELIGRLPMEKGDQLHFVDSSSEPEVTRIDAFKEAVSAADSRTPCCVVGIGGGNALDTAKAVANLLTNPGKAEDYQGWELVKNPAVYKIGIPTLSGTGSECSRTCVLTNIPKNLKLGMNSDYTVYDQLLLDPDLLATVPRDQYFYTGIDTFMHCVESLQGSYRNAIIDAFSVRAVQLCEEIFLSDDMMSEDNREKMMIASYIGGMAAGNVGVIHPFSAGLGVVLHVAHGLGNCLALNVLGDIYPKEYKQFRTMIERQGVNLPTGICKDLTEEQYEGLYRGCIVHEKPLTNALGPDFKQILTRENLIERYQSLERERLRRACPREGPCGPLPRYAGRRRPIRSANCPEKHKGTRSGYTVSGSALGNQRQDILWTSKSISADVRSSTPKTRSLWSWKPCGTRNR